MSAQRTIWKYKILRPGPQSVLLPVGATPVYFAMQGIPTLWCEVDIDGGTELEYRTFEIVGTGHEIPPKAVYVGTCLDGPYVWHLYERPPDAT